MVIVGDDCALPPPPRGPVGRRGLAGTLFVHKVRARLMISDFVKDQTPFPFFTLLTSFCCEPLLEYHINTLIARSRIEGALRITVAFNV